MDEHIDEPNPKAAESQEKRADTRRTKTIRFSEFEWEGVGCAVNERGIPAAEYVRPAEVDAVECRIAALNAEMVETIREIFWTNCIAPTPKRHEMLFKGRDDELGMIVEAARVSQAQMVRETLHSERYASCLDRLRWHPLRIPRG